jgi:hypothetical protein
MKKTIAKLMAAAMLVASLPAVAMPTFDVNAATSDAVTTSKVKTGLVIVNGEVQDPTKALKPEIKIEANEGGSTNFKLNVTLYAPQGGSYTYNGVTYNELKDYTFDAKEYKDDTGALTKIKTNANGNPVLYFDSAKLDTYKNNTILKGNEPKCVYINVADGINNVASAIPVGTQISTSKDTKFTGQGFTEDGFISGADVTIDKAGHATLLSVPDTSKKVTMLKQKIDVSNIIIAGIAFPVEKLDDQALKGAKMKTITAKNVKHLGSGCLRNCKKLRKARLGGAKMRKIHSNAFYDCEKLKNIKLNVKNLKSVGSKAFMKVKAGCTIALKAPTKKYNKVVKMIKKSGTGKVKFKKA